MAKLVLFPIACLLLTRELESLFFDGLSQIDDELDHLFLRLSKYGRGQPPELVGQSGLALAEDGGRGQRVDLGFEYEGRASILGILVEFARSKGLDILGKLMNLIFRV